MRLAYERGLFVKKLVFELSFNAVSRLIGMSLRVLLIFWGVLTLVFVVFMGVVVFCLWLILPVLIIVFLIEGITRL